MPLNKEKSFTIPRVRVRQKGQKLPKTVKRMLAFMDGTARTAYRAAMLDAGRTYEENQKKAPRAEKSDGK